MLVKSLSITMSSQIPFQQHRTMPAIEKCGLTLGSSSYFRKNLIEIIQVF